MKVIIAGGRDFQNWGYFCNTMSKWGYIITEVVCGDAAGADTIGARWANNNNIPIKHFPAEWDRYGKSAGYIRNAEMGEYADALIAFWNGHSTGTKHMIKTMKINKKPYLVFDYTGNLIEKGE